MTCFCWIVEPIGALTQAVDVGCNDVHAILSRQRKHVLNGTTCGQFPYSWLQSTVTDGVQGLAKFNRFVDCRFGVNVGENALTLCVWLRLTYSE